MLDPGESIIRLVAVTQDRDLIREPAFEPFVDLIDCRESEAPGSFWPYGRNPRLLYLQTVGEDEPRPWLGFSIYDRFRVGTETPIGIAVDKELRHQHDDARLFSHRIAKRYTRPAVPDALNAWQDAVNDALASHLRYESPAPLQP